VVFSRGFVALAVLVGVLTPPASGTASSGAAPYQTTITNTDGAGQVVRFDTAGNAVDAHDGDLAFFGGVYYLYGTSYDCGYQLRVDGAPFCGFKVYSSPDLVHWTDKGYLFNAGTAQWQARCAPPTYGCYRPHVVYNASTQQYVLWINGYDNKSGYHVFTAPSPVGPFVEGQEPDLDRDGTGAGFNNGDMDLFVDDDGSAYLAYTVISGHVQVVQRLDSTYTTGVGQAVEVGLSGTEAPSLFRRGNTYYYVHGTTCPYCAAPTRYKTASSPLGPWSATAVQIHASSCDGQPSFVSAIPTTTGTTYLYGVDLWDSRAANQAVANYFWMPLSFAANGAIEPLTCPASVTLNLQTGAPGAQDPVPDLDQHAGVAGFHRWCDIASGWSRLQSFTPSRSGVLNGASFTTYQRGATADLVIDVVTVDALLRPITTLRTITVPRNTIGWSPRQVEIRPNLAVSAGVRYALLARSSTTAGCYGFAYSDRAPYPGGGGAYRSGSGAWTVEANRTLKFHTTVGGPNRAAGATVSANSTYIGGGWGLQAVNDGLVRSSVGSSYGWSSDMSLGADHPEWVQFYLGQNTSVSRVVLYPRSDHRNIGQGSAEDVQVELSTDGTNWMTPAQRTGLTVDSSGRPLVLEFTPGNAQYVRVVGTKLRNTNPNDPAYRMQLAEVEIF
jgi:hypothetical protein